MPEINAKCVVCGANFIGLRKSAKYCGPECGRIGNNRGRPKRARKRKNKGAGGYWRGDKWVEISWGGKISNGLKAREVVNKKCAGCGKEFEAIAGREELSKWCSWRCGYENNYINAEPVLKKAKVFGANLVMGRGKQEILVGYVASAQNTPCKYCGTRLTLENMSIDHMTPYRSSEIRKNKAETRHIREQFDRPENLQIICYSCNQHKGQLTDAQFSSFLEFLDKDPDMKGIVLTRFSQARTFWRMKR